MNKVKAIITDDEYGAREVLRTLIQDFFPDIELVAICENLKQCVEAIRKYKPAVVFMDIEMPEYNGLEIHDFLDEDELDFELVFTTAYNEYATEAFRLAAIDYLLKPIQFGHLQEAVERIFHAVGQKTAVEQLRVLKNNLAGASEKKICVSTTEGKYYIPFSDLLYMEADGSYTHIYSMGRKKIYAGRRLKFFEEMLNGDSRFIRPHRSFLVNMDHIEILKKGEEPHFLLKDGFKLPIAADRVKEMEQVFL